MKPRKRIEFGGQGTRELLHIERSGTAEHRVDNHLARRLCHSLSDIDQSLTWSRSPAFDLSHRDRAECRAKASSLSYLKVGATARRCHLQSAPSAMNDVGPSIGDNSCRATSSLRKRCGRATRMSWISSGSLTRTESKNRVRYRTKPSSSYSARG